MHIFSLKPSKQSPSLFNNKYNLVSGAGLLGGPVSTRTLYVTLQMAYTLPAEVNNKARIDKFLGRDLFSFINVIAECVQANSE